MNADNKIIELNWRATLSTLWIFVFLNIIFRDIHGFFRTGFLEEIMTGTVDGVLITEELLLIFGILVEIPIAMVLLSRVLKYKVNFWANSIASVLMIVVIIDNGVADLDDIFFVTIQIIGLLAIIWYAWKWPKPAS
ncbi:DUF6326 family protein [Chengkuizengella sediminis]|uniref:DUF6326 family protein n=1 Tax=Chengkuizengella sediminis TaxID=1885917 RepID=UPI00138A0DF3|nr:DUF6326 family protein [Chengkuizengella sediminis]NDI35014.1 hypothetical protein [Chengkuizengella sediminis]